jgi:hypothetical protein
MEYHFIVVLWRQRQVRYREETVRKLASFCVLALLLAAGCTSPGPRRGVVVQPVLNMHSAPRDTADVVSQARLGQTVVWEEERPGWAHIRTPDDYPGWVRIAGIRRLASGALYPAVPEQVFVTSLRAHLYPVPSVTRQAPLFTAPFETVLELTARKDDRWLQVRLPDNRLAWVQSGDVAFEASKLSREELLAFARRFLELPYTWGGTTAFGYDCSGFTQMLCRRGGLAIPRDAKPQALWDGMDPVDRSALQPGDLLYFGPSMDRINHTGFYLGGGEFIHSTTSSHPVIQISRLEDEPWTRSFVCARRWKPA